MKTIKICTKKKRVSQRRQLRWRSDVRMKICRLDLKQKKMRRSCTDWLSIETERERCTARKGYEG